MKKLFTFLASGLFMVSLSAQTIAHNSFLPDHRNLSETAQSFNSARSENTNHFTRFAVHKPKPGFFLKSGNTIMQKLDSTIYSDETMDGSWLLSGKKEYRYSTSGKLIQLVSYDSQEKRPGTQWVEFSKAIYTYKDNDLLIEKISSRWDSDAGDWQAKWKTEYFYNNEAKVMLIYNYSLGEGSGEWEYSRKTEFSYNESGLISAVIRYDRDTDSGEWVEDFKTTYAYDKHENPTVLIDYEWDGNQWVYDFKTEYTYNASNYAELLTGFLWDGSQWQYDRQTEFFYDDQWRLTMEVEYYRNNAQWINDDKYIYVFEDNGNLLSETHYNWDENTETWMDYNRDDYTYNNEYPFEKLVLPVIGIWGNDYWWKIRYNHMLLTDVYSLPVAGDREWDDKYKSVMHYSEIEVLSVPENSFSDVLIYPNPAGDEFRIAVPGLQTAEIVVEIFDLNGRKLMEQRVSTPKGEIKTKVSSLQSGMYICRLTSGRESISRKLVIR
ncbi:MAG: T9SS type A sorting domain-containing protein [Bacteroidales bacterium]|nr:T9SS type A sorting domain-containing protein [Bacteroidales bacterium]MCF6341912.1 T9SS type A sorting domain-containing protein [Bacteroidales bacterium]